MKTKFKDFLLYSLAIIGAVSLFLSTSYKQGLVQNGRYNISTTTTKGQPGLVYETILDTNLKIEDVLNEFVKSPIYGDQIINEDCIIESLMSFKRAGASKCQAEAQVLQGLNKNPSMPTQSNR